MLLKKCVFRIFPTLLDILMRQKSTKFVGTLLAAGMISSFAGMTILSEAKAKGKITANDVLNDRELNGLALFDGKANCAACHPSTPSDDQSAPGAVFTDFSYDNLDRHRRGLAR